MGEGGNGELTDECVNLSDMHMFCIFHLCGKQNNKTYLQKKKKKDNPLSHGKGSDNKDNEDSR